MSKNPYFNFSVRYTGSVCEFWKAMLSTPWFDLISILVAITWSSAPAESDGASQFTKSIPWSAWAVEGSEVSRSRCDEWTEAWVFLTYTSEDPLLFWESRVLFSLEDMLAVPYLFSTSTVAIWPVSVPFEHEVSAFVCEVERSSLRVSLCVVSPHTEESLSDFILMTTWSSLDTVIPLSFKYFGRLRRDMPFISSSFNLT